VVSTTIGAEGIVYNSGKDILIANSREDFARAVIQVLMDSHLAQLLGSGGRSTSKLATIGEKSTRNGIG